MLSKTRIKELLQEFLDDCASAQSITPAQWKEIHESASNPDDQISFEKVLGKRIVTNGGLRRLYKAANAILETADLQERMTLRTARRVLDEVLLDAIETAHKNGSNDLGDIIGAT